MKEWIRDLTLVKPLKTVWVVKYGKQSYDIFNSRWDAIRFHPGSNPVKVKNK